MQEVKVMAVFGGDGPPQPVRFKIETEDGCINVNVDRVGRCQHRAFFFIYECSSLVAGTRNDYKLQYEKDTYKWYFDK